MSGKKRIYLDLYIQYGFVATMVHGEEIPQCGLCTKVLTNDSMKPNKLKQQLNNVHSAHED